MKTLFTILGLLIATSSFAQSTNKVTDFKILVTVDSAEEIESTFKVNDFEEVLSEVDDNEDVTFEIVCNGDTTASGKKTTLSYRVAGNTNDVHGFLKSVKKVRKAAIKYYKNKE